MTDSDYAEYCKSRTCGSEQIKGGRDQFCFCVRDHIRCLDGHFASLQDKCDTANALEGTYAELCPELCAALPRITPRPAAAETASGGVVVSPQLILVLMLMLMSFAVSASMSL